MVVVTITEKGGGSRVENFDKSEISIGRIQGNDIVLPKSNISKRHARLVVNDGAVVVIDSKSTNGTYINGKRIDAPYDLRGGDKIFVGDFTLEVESEAQAPKSAPPPPPADAVDDIDGLLADDEWAKDDGLKDDWGDDWGADDATGHVNQPEQPADPLLGLVDEALAPVDKVADLGASLDELDALVAEQKKPAEVTRTQGTGSKPKSKAKPKSKTKAPLPPAPARAPRATVVASTDAHAQALRVVHERLLQTLDLRRLNVESMDDNELRTRTRAAVEEVVSSMEEEGELPPKVDADALVQDVLNEAIGLGPLEDLLQDDSVSEILVNGPQHIYVEREGRLQESNRSFSSEQAVLGVIERIVAPLGRRIDESSPMVDARLKDGSRVNAIIPPLALGGPTLTIRKFTREPLQVDDLVVFGTLTPEIAQFLEACVRARKTLLISGGTGSGKTTTLNVLSGYIPEGERIITIEDAAELKLEQPHVVSLESRPPNIEGKGAITIRDLVRNALRMRPDRIVVGECRGGEALDMLQAMNTGHDGSLTTVHANSPRDALSRLETMVLMSGMELPMHAIRGQIASAVDVVVQQTRFSDGSRRITEVSEITGIEGDVISMQDIFVFERTGFDGDGRISGHFRPTGVVPRFYEELQRMGVEVELDIFRE